MNRTLRCRGCNSIFDGYPELENHLKRAHPTREIELKLNPTSSVPTLETLALRTLLLNNCQNTGVPRHFEEKMCLQMTCAICCTYKNQCELEKLYADCLTCHDCIIAYIELRMHYTNWTKHRLVELGLKGMASENFSILEIHHGQKITVVFPDFSFDWKGGHDLNLRVPNIKRKA